MRNRSISVSTLLPVIIGAALTVLAAPAAPLAPPLERPALRTARAASAVLLGIATAGKRLVAVGERGIIIWSDDGGRRWTQAEVPVSVTLTAVSFAGPGLGWAAGHGGVILHSADGGKSWVRQLDGIGAAQLEFDHAKRVAAANPADERAAARLADAGRMLREGADKPFLDIDFDSASDGYAVGAFGQLLHTADGGHTWESLGDRLENPNAAHLYSVHVAASDIWITGEQGLVFHSTDGGASFGRVSTPYQGSLFGQVQTGAGQAPVVLGLKGHAEFAPAGEKDRWGESVTGTSSSIMSGIRLADGRLVVATMAGSLLESRDGGAHFYAVPMPPAAPLTGLAQAFDGGLVVVGLGGARRLDTMAHGND